MAAPQPVDHAVPVPGGELNVAWYGPEHPEAVAVGIHGITASSRSYAAVAQNLPPEVALLAVDLRGRGRSAGLPGPYGMRNHAADVVRVLDHFGLDRAVMAGHSMGAYVAAVFAEAFADRVQRVVLIDGGFRLPAPPGLSPDEVIEAVIGPALARLSMTFASVDDYFDFWRQHPAIGPYWSDALEVYFSYDLAGRPPQLHSRVNEEAVRCDGRELVVDETVASAVERVRRPMHLLRVDRGLMDEPGGLVPDDLAHRLAATNPHVRVTTIEGLNHYTLMMGRGASAVASAIADA